MMFWDIEKGLEFLGHLDLLQGLDPLTNVERKLLYFLALKSTGG